MALAAKRILVTDTGNGRGRRPFPSNARPSTRVYTSPTPTLPVPGQSNYFFLLFFLLLPLSFFFPLSPWKKVGRTRSPLEIFTYTTPGCTAVIFLPLCPDRFDEIDQICICRGESRLLIPTELKHGTRDLFISIVDKVEIGRILRM